MRKVGRKVGRKMSDAERSKLSDAELVTNINKFVRRDHGGTDRPAHHNSQFEKYCAERDATSLAKKMRLVGEFTDAQGLKLVIGIKKRIGGSLDEVKRRLLERSCGGNGKCCRRHK